MQVGMIGLGRMGSNMARRLMRGGHACVAHDHSPEMVRAIAAEGAVGATTLDDLVARLAPPRVVWLMVPAVAVTSTLDELVPRLQTGDVVVDGGNSHYQHSRGRAERLASSGIHFVDCGTSGGVWGLERGYCLMLGGEPDVVRRLEPLFETLAPGAGFVPPTRGSGERSGTAARGYLHCGTSGAGHFAKMVHNGIEYGLMAAYAEGFNLLHHVSQRDNDASAERDRPRFEFDLPALAEVWRRGSVVSSWLLDLTAAALAGDPTLDSFDGRVGDSGEGRWALDLAVEQGVPAHVLAAALFQRFSSRGGAAFQDRLLSAMRFEFGGHVERSEPSA
jgi:6-phosphogluconate dehydrogenase